MANAIFALMMAAGIAIAWHSNPMYSLGRTVRFIALNALALAILVGAIIAVTNASEHLSATQGGVALALTILFGTMFFIWAIVTTSTPRPHGLARNTKLVFVNRAHVIPWIKRVAVVLVAFGIVVAVLPGETREVVLIIGGMFAGLAICMVFTLFIAALGMDRSLTSIEAAPWIHWTYSADAWSAWRAVLVSRSIAKPRSWIWSRDWKILAVSMGVVALALVAMSYGGAPLPFSIWFMVGITILLLVAIEAMARFDAAAPKRLGRLLLNAPPETYAGAAGIFCDGVFVQWMTPSAYLISATIDETAPRCIDLQFAQIATGSPTLLHFTQSVLIPPDAGADMRTLQTQLAARCPSAIVALI